MADPFEALIREMKKLERSVKVTISLPLDAEGYLDRQCPASDCRTLYKVHFGDSETKIRQDAVYCPICGYAAPSTDWNTPEQIRQIKRQGMRHMHKRVGEALEQGTRAFNRASPTGSMLNMTMSYRPGALPPLLPMEAAEAMRQKIVCPDCGLRYSTIGAAFFCPGCGHNDIETSFAQTVETVCQVVEKLGPTKSSLIGIYGEDVAANIVRHLTEDSLVKLVGCFQRYMEVQFTRLPQSSRQKARRNVFQNLGESAQLWQSVGLRAYSDLISPLEYATMKRLFQQRHLLAHRDGIVDQDYIDKSADSSTAVGQRLVVTERSVRELASLVSKLADAVTKDVSAAQKLASPTT